MLDDEPNHRSAASLRPYRLHLHAAVWPANIKERMDHAHGLAYAPPIEEVLIFFGRKMNEYAVVSPHTVYEQVGQKVFPKLSDGFVASSFEHHVLLHAVGHDAIERTEQAVEETRNPKVMLCKLQCRFAERCSPQMLVCLTVVGEQCRQLGGRLEVLKTQPVLSREFVAAFQLLRQFFYSQSRCQ